MAQNHYFSSSEPSGVQFRQLEFCFDAQPLPAQERNSELETAIAESTIPEFLKEAKPFLDYPNPRRIPEILFEYFPGQFGRKQVLDSSDLLKLRKTVRGVYDTYSSWMDFLTGAVPYSLDDAYLKENTWEKEALMREHLGIRVRKQIDRYGGCSGYETKIGVLFRTQVQHYQKLITQGNRRRKD